MGFEFELVEREPDCYGYGIYPWDDESFTSLAGITGEICNGYRDTSPSVDHPIGIRVFDGVSGTQSSATYGNEPFSYTMTANNLNPFAPFSLELSAEFTRSFDGICDFAKACCVDDDAQRTRHCVRVLRR